MSALVPWSRHKGCRVHQTNISISRVLQLVEGVTSISAALRRDRRVTELVE